MKIDLALLADYALAHEDGKLYVTGGGIRGLQFPAFPAKQPHLALALGIEVLPAELGADHALGIEASGPTTDTIFPPVRITFTVPRQKSADEAGYIHVVSNMDNVSFPAEGDYMFAMTIDGERLADVRVRIERGGNVSEEAEANSLLMDGYRAFQSGDAEAAEAVFRGVVARFPKVAGGHNNLGFVLLAKGDARGALTAFVRASELTYSQPEITTANVACALYLMGDVRKALEFFRRCLELVFRTRSILFCVSGDRLMPVELLSAADYVALESLNAAWSARRSNDVASAERYFAAARASELARSADERASPFRDSIRAFEESD